jgi:cytochrome c-type biogenesis protein CcmH
MTVFLSIAVLLAVVTAAYLSRPLWRDGGGSRIAGIITVLALLVGSAAFYAWSSRWDWSQAETASTANAMVGKLARRLERQPDDVEGWLTLGRSHNAIGQYPLAIRAFQRADRLQGGRNAEAVLGIAEAMMMQNDNVMDDRSGRLFERALELDPESGRTLFFAAIAAQNRQEVPVAIERFERLLTLDPPPEVRSIIETQIATLRGGGAEPAVAAAPAGVARITVQISIAPSMAPRLTPGATLFVFVRAPGRPGPPLAAKRLPAVLPATVVITPQDSMLPGVVFASGDEVEVSAKISSDGSATPKTGEPVGRLTYTVGRDLTRSLVIDGLTP